MQTVTLKVEGMSCGHCVSSVEGAVRKLGSQGKVDLAGKSVTVVAGTAMALSSVSVVLNALRLQRLKFEL